MMPVMIVLCGWIGHRMSVPLSRYNNSVYLAEQVRAERFDPTLEETLQTKTYRAMGTSETELIAKAQMVRKQMNMGGWLLGGFLGLVFSLKLIGISVSRTRKDYEVNKPTCFSCGRCCSYCPSDDMHRANFSPGSKPYNEALSLKIPLGNADGTAGKEGEKKRPEARVSKESKS